MKPHQSNVPTHIVEDKLRQPHMFSAYRGSSINDFIDELGAYRIKIFKEFPYLYEGFGL